MKIGIVTTWFERGAAYVSRTYKNMLEREGHEVFIYARGGEEEKVSGEKWNETYVTRDYGYRHFRITKRIYNAWIIENKIDALFFNEQQDFRIVIYTKKKYPKILLGAYIDYYTERTRKWYNIYDFVVCNTQRHMQAMEGHPQRFYLRWGTDLDVYKPSDNEHDTVVFFHSVGMSARKGTDILVNAFINGECYKKSKLIIHTQIPIIKVTPYSREYLEQFNIEIIEKTVSAPGLYFLGDVYVYPTRLDGLGLTIYEALASGLPVITTDFPPMNEAVNESCGKLVKVKDFYCRNDAYYYPMAICDEESLVNCMNYYINHPEELAKQKKMARQFAVERYKISERSRELSSIFTNAKHLPLDSDIEHDIMRYYYKEKNNIFDYSEDNRLLLKLKETIIGIFR